MSNSADALAWALKTNGISSDAKFILVLLSLRVGQNGFIVWPSIPKLAEESLLSESTVRRRLKELASGDHPLIDVLEAWRDNGGRSSNRYRLLVKTLHRLPGGRTIVVDATAETDLDAPLQDDRGGGVRLTGGGCPVDRGAPVTADRGNMNSEYRTESREPSIEDEDRFDTDLFDQPILTEEQRLAQLKARTVEIIEEGWKQLADECPKIARLRGNKIDDARADTAYQRADKFASEGETAIDVWQSVFRQIRSSRWLCGETAPRGGRPPFTLQMTWLLEHRNFTKVLEGKFSDGRDPEVHGGGTGRNSPAGNAVRKVLDRRGLGGNGRAGRGTGSSPYA